MKDFSIVIPSLYSAENFRSRLDSQLSRFKLLGCTIPIHLFLQEYPDDIVEKILEDYSGNLNLTFDRSSKFSTASGFRIATMKSSKTEYFHMMDDDSHFPLSPKFLENYKESIERALEYMDRVEKLAQIVCVQSSTSFVDGKVHINFPLRTCTSNGKIISKSRILDPEIIKFYELIKCNEDICLGASCHLAGYVAGVVSIKPRIKEVRRAGSAFSGDAFGLRRSRRMLEYYVLNSYVEEDFERYLEYISTLPKDLNVNGEFTPICRGAYLESKISYFKRKKDELLQKNPSLSRYDVIKTLLKEVYS